MAAQEGNLLLSLSTFSTQEQLGDLQLIKSAMSPEWHRLQVPPVSSGSCPATPDLHLVCPAWELIPASHFLGNWGPRLDEELLFAAKESVLDLSQACENTQINFCVCKTP